MEGDYKQINELDRYENEGIDEEQYSDIDDEDRMNAERANEQRN